MEPFTIHTGNMALLDRGNVDTDQIISKEFLKSISRTGFGPHLFHDWRYLPDGKPNPHFELNNPVYEGATILVAGNNFGCGSSREHAVWAISQYGFKVVMAPIYERHGEIIPAFADIFRNNSSKNGLLLIELPEKTVNEIKKFVSENAPLQATIDLPSQSITLHLSPEKKVYHFLMDAGLKQKFLEGLDEIGMTERYIPQIEAFEAKHSTQMV